MSKYREIKTEFRNLDSLKKALADCGVPYQIAANPRVPDLGLYGYHDDLRPEQASIVINREWINDHWSGVGVIGKNYYRGISNDIGFAWDGSQFTGIVSDYDQTRQGVTDALNKLRQRYGFHEVQRLARSKGYTVRETATDTSGQIRLVLVRR